MEKQTIRIRLPGFYFRWDRPVPEMDQYGYRNLKEGKHTCIILTVLIIVAGIVVAVLFG